MGRRMDSGIDVRNNSRQKMIRKWLDRTDEQEKVELLMWKQKNHNDHDDKHRVVILKEARSNNNEFEYCYYNKK